MNFSLLVTSKRACKYSWHTNFWLKNVSHADGWSLPCWGLQMTFSPQLSWGHLCDSTILSLQRYLGIQTVPSNSYLSICTGTNVHLKRDFPSIFQRKWVVFQLHYRKNWSLKGSLETRLANYLQIFSEGKCISNSKAQTE